MFALYGLLTRYVARKDAASVTFFWVGITGAVVMTPLGLLSWTPMSGQDWIWMGVLCCTAAGAHFESRYFMTFVWLPPARIAARMISL